MKKIFHNELESTKYSVLFFAKCPYPVPIKALKLKSV